MSKLFLNTALKIVDDILSVFNVNPIYSQPDKNNMIFIENEKISISGFNDIYIRSGLWLTDDNSIDSAITGIFDNNNNLIYWETDDFLITLKNYFPNISYSILENMSCKIEILKTKKEYQKSIRIA